MRANKADPKHILLYCEDELWKALLLLDQQADDTAEGQNYRTSEGVGFE
jgi:hypothetical protein